MFSSHVVVKISVGGIQTGSHFQLLPRMGRTCYTSTNYNWFSISKNQPNVYRHSRICIYIVQFNCCVHCGVLTHIIQTYPVIQPHLNYVGIIGIGYVYKASYLFYVAKLHHAFNKHVHTQYIVGGVACLLIITTCQYVSMVYLSNVVRIMRPSQNSLFAVICYFTSRFRRAHHHACVFYIIVYLHGNQPHCECLRVSVFLDRCFACSVKWMTDLCD